MPQPLVPPPVGDTGALTYPRTLLRWLDVNPVSRLTRTNTFITLPAFTQGGSTWNGYSDIVASFNCESPNNFSIVGLTGDVPASPSYVLCVSYRIGGTVTRYLLWNAVGSNMNQTIPLYTGQPIKKNFRFEVWNTSQGAAGQATAIQFYTSVLSGQDYRYAVDSTLKVVDAENDSFSVSAVDGISDTHYWYTITLSNAGVVATNQVYTISSWVQTTLVGVTTWIPTYTSADGLYIITFVPNGTPDFSGVWYVQDSTLVQPVQYYSANGYNTHVYHTGPWTDLSGNHQGCISNLSKRTTLFIVPLALPLTSVSTTN